MAFKQKSPIGIIEGGTNTQSFSHVFGVAYYDGLQLNNIEPGVSGYVLTSNGIAAPSFQSISAHGAVTEMTADTGSALPSSGIIDLAGGTNINTSASGDTITINLDDSPSVSGSITAGTGLIATTGGLTVSAGTITLPYTTTGALVSTAAGVITDADASTSGYILTSNGAGIAPSFQANGITQGIVTINGSTGSVTGATVSIEGTNSNIVTAGSGTAFTIALADSVSVSGSMTAGTGLVATTGGLTVSAGTITTPFASYGALVSDTSGVITDAASTAGYVLTGNTGAVPTFQAISASGAVTSFTSDSGTATPSSGVIDLAGGSNINTSATGNTVTVNLNSSPSVSGSITAGTGVIATTGGLTATDGGLTVTAGTITISPFTTTGALVSDASGVITDANASTAGYVLTSNGAGSAPNFQAIQNFTWNDQVTSTVTMAASNGYIMDNGASLITATLPTTIALGQIISIQGKGSGLWTIAQNAGQTIHFGAINTTTGAGGSLSSNGQYDSLDLLCITANTDFAVRSSIGNLSWV